MEYVGSWYMRRLATILEVPVFKTSGSSVMGAPGVGVLDTTESRAAKAGANTSAAKQEDIFSAARVGAVDRVEQFLAAGVAPSVRDAKGNTALIVASGRGFDDVIRVLLDAGATVNEATANGIFEGKCALSWAASQGRVAAVLALLKAGADAQEVQQAGVFAGKTPVRLPLLA